MPTREQLKRIIAVTNPELLPTLEQQDTNDLLKQVLVEVRKERSLNVEGIEMLKGDKGDKPVAGIDFPIPKDGEDGYTPVKGVDYFDGKDAEPVDINKVVKKLIPHIPDPIPGEPGKDGSSDTPEQVALKLNTLKNAVDVSVIKGAVAKEELARQDKKVLDGMAKIEGRVKLIDQRWHGGGLSSVSHDTTLTGTGNPSSPLSVIVSGGHVIEDEGVPLTQRTNLNFVGAGVTVTDDAGNNATVVTIPSGSFSLLTPTGTVDGSNQTFVFTSAPSVIVVDQGRTMQKVSSDGTINWTGTTTVVLAVAPISDIFGF